MSNENNGNEDGSGLSNRPLVVPVAAVVLSCIAIYLLIHVPGFLEAQVRAKISRVRIDMRSVADALGRYWIEHNDFPAAAVGAESVNQVAEDNPLARLPSFRVSTDPDTLATLTTPIGYITEYPADPFAKSEATTFVYWVWGEGPTREWILVSPGPDREYEIDPAKEALGSKDGVATALSSLTYDPTNGTRSHGDIWLNGWARSRRGSMPGE